MGKTGKRTFSCFLVAVFLICLLDSCCRCSAGWAGKLDSRSRNENGTQKHFLYVGTFTKDIYVFEQVDAVWTPKGRVETIGSPSFLAANVAGDRLYAVNELDESEGAVSAFAIDRNVGHLTLINRVGSGGHGPTHLAIDPFTGRYLLIAHYGSGNIVALRLRLDGSIGDLVYSVDPLRPQARAHQVAFDLLHGYTLGVFFGLDEIRFYSLNENSGDLNPIEVSRRDGQPNRRLTARVPNGSGPRHLKYSRDGRYFYVVSEKASTLAVFSSSFPTSDGSYGLIQLVTSLPEDVVRRPNFTSYAAEIDIHPTGKYLYVTNRGDDSVAVFAVNTDDGTVRHIQFVPSGGLYPRHIVLNSNGTTAFVSNQNGDGGVQLFDVDPKSGHLKPREKLEVPKSVCAVLVPS